MSRKAYRSDLTDAQWDILKEYIPEPAPGGRPAAYERREIVNAILYVLRTGCGWEYVPHDLPPWKLVYHYFQEWSKSGVWEQTNAALTQRSRQQQGRAPSPSLAIIDTQSAQTSERGV